MPIETFPTGSTHQPENNGDFSTHLEGLESGRLVDYSERPEYLRRDATKVAIEVFGKDLRKPGMFFTEAGSDLDVPYRVECRGDGDIATYNILRSDIYEGTPVGWRGLNGYVITAEEARLLTTA